MQAFPFGTTARRRDSVDEAFAKEALFGLSQPRKSLPSRFLYDARGSALFEEITRLPEYYPTRAEIEILEKHGHEMIEEPADAVLVEFGSGSSRKTELLLERFPSLAAYVPIDVSRDALDAAALRLAKHFPRLDIRPIVGDFAELRGLAGLLPGRRRIGFFPGSTIGNFSPLEAVDLLSNMRLALAPQGRLIIGVDLRKERDRLIAAYNDAAGVTAAFNLNLLERVNRELDGTFEVEAFQHAALYDSVRGRIEMHLVAKDEYEVFVRGRRFRFCAEETIHTENSYKFTVTQFQDLARRARWTPRRFWTDAETLFSVHELIAG